MKNYLILLFFLFTSCSSNSIVRIGNEDVYKDINLLANVLSEEIVENYKGQDKLKVVIFPVVSENNTITDFSNKLSRLLKIELFKKQRFDILERSQLDDLLSELKLTTTSDMFSKENINKLGKFTGADAVLLGELIKFENYHTINLKLVDITNTKIISVSQKNYMFDSEKNILKGYYQLKLLYIDPQTSQDYYDISIYHDTSIISSFRLHSTGNITSSYALSKIFIDPNKEILFEIWGTTTHVLRANENYRIHTFIIGKNFKISNLDQHGILHLKEKV